MRQSRIACLSWCLNAMPVHAAASPPPPDNASIKAIRDMLEAALQQQWYSSWWFVALIGLGTSVAGGVGTHLITRWLDRRTP